MLNRLKERLVYGVIHISTQLRCYFPEFLLRQILIPHFAFLQKIFIHQFTILQKIFSRNFSFLSTFSFFLLTSVFICSSNVHHGRPAFHHFHNFPYTWYMWWASTHVPPGFSHIPRDFILHCIYSFFHFVGLSKFLRSNVLYHAFIKIIGSPLFLSFLKYSFCFALECVIIFLLKCHEL